MENESRSDEQDSPNNQEEVFEIEVTDVIDLHAFHPKEVGAVAEAFLQESHRKGYRLVRLIHGKGIGVQREIVRKVLSESPLVKSFKDGDEFSGGRGATIAVLTD